MRFIAVFPVIFLIFSVQAQQRGIKYQYQVDLTQVKDDKVRVELVPPPISAKEIVFNLPKIVPGTYSIADYGRFISELEALDKNGKKLPVEKLNDNAWKIKNAQALAKIRYWVEDSFDSKLPGPEIFWPAGTNIEEDKNFILNSGGFFGYFEGMKKIPFQVNVIRKPGFYGTTGMIPQTRKASGTTLEKKTVQSPNDIDTYTTSNYDELVDSPLMYSRPDTALIKVANTEVLVGAFSPNAKITAREIANTIKDVLMAQKEYLGGKLPVNKYAFIFYFTTEAVMSYGALEHSYSSLYFMPEATLAEMEGQLRDFAAHEFFHIVTPLTIHSKEIGDFDFNAPKMSKHLWMYEGVTEYFAGNVQVKYGLITPEQYLQTLKEKMNTADRFLDDLPFTDLSKNTLDKYHDQYYNVYQKGALIGLCLDLKLRKLSTGKYGLPNLLMELSAKYGKDNAFNDDELFATIEKMTYPEIGEFFKKHVEGPEPLPLKEVFESVGIVYIEEEKYEDYSLGIGQNNIDVTEVDKTPRLSISDDKNTDPMAQALGFKKGDILLKINGEDIPELGPGIGPFIYRQRQALSGGGMLTYTVLRKDENGANKETELSAKAVKMELKRRHLINFSNDASDGQVALRNNWLKP